MVSAPFSLEGRVALVTGGSRGIGRETCMTLAKAGADVAVVGLDLPDLESVAAEVRRYGRESVAVEVDVTDSVQVQDTVARTCAELGRVDILVNNAGIHLTERFTEGTVDKWAACLDVNLLGPIMFARAVLDGMMERQYGKIVNIASDAGRTGSTGQAVYGASKGGVIAFTRNLATEVARCRINVNCVSPGLVDTAMWNATRTERPKLAEAYEKTIPWKRLGTSAEIAAAVLFLVSDEAEYVTGQVVSVNGGVFIG